MSLDVSSEYFRNAVLTATPEQLQLMLYDGAIRFSDQAREAVQRRDYERSCELLLKAQRVVLQMQDGLRPDANPSLVGQLAALYQFVYRRLVDANMQRSVEAIDDALQILRHQRETWQLLIERIRSEATAGDAAEPAGAGLAVSIALEG